MYREIDSAELVIYEAFQKRKERIAVNGEISPIYINMQEIVNIAIAIENEDPTVRVNLGRKSLSHLVSRSRHSVTIDGDVITISDTNSRPIRQLFYQYGPNRYTRTLLRNAKIES